MSHVAKVRSHYRFLRERTYENLEVALPGDVLSRVVSSAIVGLILLNAVVLACGLFIPLQPYARYLSFFKTVSVTILSGS